MTTNIFPEKGMRATADRCDEGTAFSWYAAALDWLPQYVPASVKTIAPLVGGDSEIKRRLLWDIRMKVVWRELEDAQVTQDAISKLEWYQRLKTWEISDEGISLYEQCCAALFAFAAVDFSQPRTIGTQLDAASLAEQHFSAAKVCRRVAAEASPFSPEQAAALATAAHIEEQTRWQVEHLLKTPYIIGKRSSAMRGDDEVRGRVRALATETRALFRGKLNGTIARMASVALGMSSTIKKESVKNWCKGLSPPEGGFKHPL